MQHGPAACRSPRTPDGSGRASSCPLAPQRPPGGSSDLRASHSPSAPSTPLLKRQRAGDSPGRFVKRQCSGPRPEGLVQGSRCSPRTWVSARPRDGPLLHGGPGPRAAGFQRCPRAPVGPACRLSRNKGVGVDSASLAGTPLCPAPWVPRSAVACAGCVEPNIQTVTTQGRGCLCLVLTQGSKRRGRSLASGRETEAELNKPEGISSRHRPPGGRPRCLSSGKARGTLPQGGRSSPGTWLTFPP